MARSFMNAFAGLRRAAAERNMRIHAVVFAAVAGAGMTAGLSVAEWIAVAVVSGGVMAAETFNTAIEILADRVCRDHDPAIRQVKDVAAAAVVIWAVAAVVTGALIFIPRITACVS